MKMIGWKRIINIGNDRTLSLFSNKSSLYNVVQRQLLIHSCWMNGLIMDKQDILLNWKKIKEIFNKRWMRMASEWEFSERYATTRWRDQFKRKKKDRRR